MPDSHLISSLPWKDGSVFDGTALDAYESAWDAYESA